MRAIVFDTETTGLDPLLGHRIVEIGAVETINDLPTGRTYHQYINPQRDIPSEVVQVHGIDNERVKDEPIFSEIFAEFLDFIQDDVLIAHNAPFDVKFINAEFRRVGVPALRPERIIDSLTLARKKFPGAQNNLDALCRRFDIDLSERTLHGALLDSQLLAEVYLELKGGRQHGLSLTETEKQQQLNTSETVSDKIWPIRDFTIDEAEKQAHEKMLKKIEDALWHKIA